MNLHLVLVRTEYAGNVGACARALANMGGGRLILIDPRCKWTSKARMMAAGAQEQLASRVEYKSWDEFYAKEGDGLRIALTRRGGRKRKVFSLEETIASLPEAPANLYLILGPEADGLDVEDLAFVNFACHLPAYGEFASYNLSQAALMGLFMIRQRFKPEVMPAQLTGEAAPSVAPMYFPDQLIKDWLTAMGFNIQARKASAYLTLRRLFLQNLPTEHEIQVLEAILQQNIRKLRLGAEAEPGLLGLASEQIADEIGDVPV